MISWIQTILQLMEQMCIFLFLVFCLERDIVLTHLIFCIRNILQYRIQYPLSINNNNSNCMQALPQPNAIPSPNSFTFVERNHNKHLYCKICSVLMLQPLRLHPCGHTLCIQCVEDKRIKQCPLCLLRIQAKQKDILASRLIGQLTVKCKNQGCPWKGTFEEFNQFHQNGCGLKEGGIQAWLQSIKEAVGNTYVENQENDKQQKHQNLDQNKQDRKEKHQQQQNENKSQDNGKIQSLQKRRSQQNREQLAKARLDEQKLFEKQLKDFKQ